MYVCVYIYIYIIYMCKNKSIHPIIGPTFTKSLSFLQLLRQILWEVSPGSIVAKNLQKTYDLI